MILAVVFFIAFGCTQRRPPYEVTEAANAFVEKGRLEQHRLLLIRIDKTNNMRQFQKRVIIEKRDLDAKITKLVIFMEGERFEPLPKSDQADMVDQLSAMEVYSKVLETRIRKF